MKLLNIFIITVLVYSCKQKPQINEEKNLEIKTKSINENHFINEISKLPEVQKYQKDLEKNHRKLLIWQNGDNTINGIKYLFYSVGEDNGNTYHTNFHFARKVDSFEILGYDIMEDKIISLQEWKNLELK